MFTKIFIMQEGMKEAGQLLGPTTNRDILQRTQKAGHRKASAGKHTARMS